MRARDLIPFRLDAFVVVLVRAWPRDGFEWFLFPFHVLAWFVFEDYRKVWAERVDRFVERKRRR